MQKYSIRNICFVNYFFAYFVKYGKICKYLKAPSYWLIFFYILFRYNEFDQYLDFLFGNYDYKCSKEALKYFYFSIGQNMNPNSVLAAKYLKIPEYLEDEADSLRLLYCYYVGQDGEAFKIFTKYYRPLVINISKYSKYFPKIFKYFQKIFQHF